jgi:hypothetical protein
MNQKRILIIIFLVFNNLSFIDSYKLMIPKIDRENCYRFNIVKNYHQTLRHQELINQEQSFSSLVNNNDDLNNVNFFITIVLLRFIIFKTYYNLISL